MVEKEFDVNEHLNLPVNLVFKNVDNYYVIVAPDKPNWLIVDTKEKDLFVLLCKNTILDALILYKKQINISEEACILILQKLLSKIDAIDFYENISSKSEDAIAKIVKSIHITTTNDCNLRCKHCYMSAGIKYQDYLDLNLLVHKIEEIEKFYDSKLDIVVSGGEPLLHPDIERFLDLIKKHHVILFTNGLLINERNVKVIAETCDSVQLSVNDTLRMYKNDDIRMYNFNCITDTIVEVITTCNTYTLLTVHLL